MHPFCLQDVGLVVLDEVHYLGDPGRGSVWEEVRLAVLSCMDIVRACFVCTRLLPLSPLTMPRQPVGGCANWPLANWGQLELAFAVSACIKRRTC